VNEERRRLLLQIGSAAVFLAIVAVAVLIVVSSNETEGGDSDLEDVGLVKRDLRGIPQSGLTLGESGAEVTLYEFGDLQCPVCKGFSEEVIPAVIDSRVRSGEAKIEFRNYTIISEESVPAATAAIAAGKQDKGWDFVELFYRNQGIEASGYVTDEFLTEIAKGAGVSDISRWNEDRKSAAVLRQVKSESQEAQSLGLTGTPSFVISGPATQGNEVLGTPGSSGSLKEAIDDAG
jgi:protein-disulfide isomerase